MMSCPPSTIREMSSPELIPAARRTQGTWAGDAWREKRDNPAGRSLQSLRRARQSGVIAISGCLRLHHPAKGVLHDPACRPLRLCHRDCARLAIHELVAFVRRAGAGARRGIAPARVRGGRPQGREDPDAGRRPTGRGHLPPVACRQSGAGSVPDAPHADALQQGRREGRGAVLRDARLCRRGQRRPGTVRQRRDLAADRRRPVRRPRGRRVDRRAGVVRRQGGDVRHELSRWYPARPGRDEPAAPDDDGSGRRRLQLRRQRDAARRGV